jgi:hypothetical protein
MPLDSYANLQGAVLDWLARPGDPLVAPAVPDMITMFEEEARDRLQTRFTEKVVTITPDPNSDTIPLPLDYGQVRSIWINTNYGRRHFTYQTPRNMDENLFYLAGYPAAFTVEGLNLRIVGNAGNTPDPINIGYLSGIIPLSNTVATNWLLQQYPSAYLWGTLAYAAPYIGDDPRAQMWLAGRETAIERIRLADRRAKYPAGLMIQTDVMRAGRGGSGGQSPIPPTPPPGPPTGGISPADGATVTLTDTTPVYVNNATTLSSLTFKLPPPPGANLLLEISFRNPVTVLSIQDYNGVAIPNTPTNAYGPGSGLEFRYVTGTGWVYWK